MADPRSRGQQQGASHQRRVLLDPARAAALDVLKAVRVDGAYANLVLPAAIRHYQLTGRDAAFATELASGTIRRRGTYDAILSACADRPLSKVEAKVLDALRIGTHQLLSMRVPDHAAISTTVDLVHARVSSGAANFTNAVLRRVTEHDLTEWIAIITPDPRVNATRFAALAYSHPEWVVDELRGALGRRNELHDLLEADNAAPRVTLVARPGRSTREELPGEPTPYSPWGVVLESGDPGAIPAVAEGRAGVQDEGSQLVAKVLADAPLEGRDELWLDLCAGPGGKAGLLAALAAQRGAALVANERQTQRAGLVQRTLTSGGSYVEGAVGVVAGDGTQPPYRPGWFDRVLVDAPCSGLGALRRRPEARWRKKADDLVPLVLLQRQLLTHALDLVRPGGVVVYATCSPVLSETSIVVTQVNSARRDVVIEDAAPLLTDVPDCAGPVPGTVQLWPHRHGTDAMFMALFRRRP